MRIGKGRDIPQGSKLLKIWKPILFLMTGYELLSKMYPEWHTESPLIIWLKIFLIIVPFLIIPYIYMKFFEGHLTIFLQKIRGKISLKYSGILRGVRPH